MGKDRSTEYPGLSISYCIVIIRKIYKHVGAKHLYRKDALAAALGKKASSISRELAACRQYGLLKMERKKGYQLTDLSIRIVKAKPGPEQKKMMLECFRLPRLYADLIDQYNENVLPSKSVLENLLATQHEKSKNGSKIAVRVFLENVEALNLIREDNQLWVEPQEEQDESYMASEVGGLVSKSHHESQFVHGENWGNGGAVGLQYRVFGITGGRQIELRFPGRLNKQDFDLLVEHLAIEIRKG